MIAKRVRGKVLRKDQRSLLLCLILGDGCLHYLHRGNKTYGSLTIDHGIKQADYQSWKAKLIGSILNRNVKVRVGHNGKSVQVAASWKRFKAWRKFCYINNKKSIPKILKFIQHPEFAASILLMDDGYVESSISTLKDGTKKNYGARFRIFLCDQSKEELDEINIWFKNNFDINLKIKYQKNKNKSYPFLKMTQKDSLKLWSNIREFILQFKSMQYKFRYIEQIYQYKLSQRNLGSE